VTDDEGATDNTTQQVTVIDLNEISAPVGLVADVVDGNNVDLTWQDTSDGEEGFSVEYAEKIRGKYNFTAIVPMAVADATSYQDIGVAPGTYKYRVRGFAGGVTRYYSEYSNEVLVKVEEVASVPSCGDGTCDSDETESSCSDDCSADVLLPKGSKCTSGGECQSGSCHPRKLTCR
jgi:hypothetical protein